jgi:hypothetical protein
MFAPVCTGGYFVVRGTFEGRTTSQIVERLQLKWVDACLAGGKFWMVANLVSFAFIPEIYRVLFGNCCTIVWNAYLSEISTRQLSQVAAKRIEKPAEFEMETITPDMLEQAVAQRLGDLHWGSIIRQAVELAWVRQLEAVKPEESEDGLPLPTLGRALAYRWSRLLGPGIETVSDQNGHWCRMCRADHQARGTVCGCAHCRAMRV